MEKSNCSKLLERIWTGINLEIPLRVFRQMKNTGCSFKELNQLLEDFKSVRNKHLGYNLGNNMHEIYYRGTSFPFLISDNTFSLWSGEPTRQTSLGSFEIDINETPSDEFIRWVEERVKDCCDGLVHCGDCDKKLPIKDSAGRYFAGVYCKDCWEHRGWKEKEAKETYN